MSEWLWTVMAAGAVQGAFLTAVLLGQRHANRRAARCLGLIVGAMTLIVTAEVLEQAASPRLASIVSYLNINTELAIGPLFFLFVRALLDPDRRFRARDGLHFLPQAAGVIIWVGAWIAQPAPANVSDVALVPYFVGIKAILLLGYGFATIRLLCTRRSFAAGRRTVGLRWLRDWLCGLAAVPLVIYATVYLERLGIARRIEPDQIGSVLLTGVIYLATLMLLLRPWVLSLRPREQPDAALREDVARLRRILERERPWLDPTLGLADLARCLGVSNSHLSRIINEGLETTFYALVNDRRLAEFERLMRDPALRRRPILNLAYDAGFNSKASFYRAFSEVHGTTPTAFRRRLAAAP